MPGQRGLFSKEFKNQIASKAKAFEVNLLVRAGLEDVTEDGTEIFSGPGMIGTECKIGLAAATSEVHGANIVAVFAEEPGGTQYIGALGISFKSVQQDDNPIGTLWLTRPV
jgi:hypothetical protein